jgi:hypothetical protein
MALLTALPKSLKMKDSLLCTKVPLSTFLGSLTPFIGVGILGSVRFGLYENFKKSMAKSSGLQNAG